jgi:hypothetical protein
MRYDRAARIRDAIADEEAKYAEPFHYLLWNVLIPVGTFCTGIVIIHLIF